MIYDYPIELVRSTVLDDWYIIRRADVENPHQWLQKCEWGYQFIDNTRIGEGLEADVEGDAAQMSSILAAIEQHVPCWHKRVAFVPGKDGTGGLHSPRNSRDVTYFTPEALRAFLNQARQILPA